MKKNALITISASLLLAYSGGAHSSSFFAEFQSGDLTYYPTSAFSLSQGENTFLGLVGGNYNSFDFDSFAFTIPSQTQLTGITGNFDFFSTYETPILSANLALVPGLAPSIASSQQPKAFDSIGVTESKTTQQLFTSSTPLSAGTYNLSFSSFNFESSIPRYQSGFVDYHFTLTVQTVEPPPPVAIPPTTLQLAKISSNVYTDAPASVDGYNVVASWLDPTSKGFYAFAYKKSDPVAGDEIVIAFRGTDQLKNIFTDVAFGPDSAGGGLNALLPDFVTQATQFVRSVAFANQSASQITLTGHSLGGAIAEMIGSYTGLATQTFNAPGTTESYERLSQFFEILGDGAMGIPGLRPGTIVNNRIYGDQVSLLGTAQGQVYTYLPQIVNDDNGYNFGTNVLNATGEIGKEVETMLYTHSMGNFVNWIESASPIVKAGYSGPGLYPFIPGQCSGLLCQSIGFFSQVLADVMYLLDPPPSNGYLWQVGSGPFFDSVGFMRYPDNPMYELLTWNGEDWFSNGFFHGGDVFQFGADGVDRFLIYGLDPLNNTMRVLPEYFFLGVKFSSSGLFQGTVEFLPTGNESSVPEPPILVIVFTNLCALYLLRYRYAMNRRKKDAKG